ncbi:hypothetical protein RG47T_3950 [Mucilaginibacter polytrichastri]|uniref:Uncharacterized protein n=1 Tax=Mucilaginibacter polytrichastri TaxID=1302689 RepID=A0A1Q6A3A6_9SPHI|nr:hypothetical protein RG47T_3950 [Mucilaginibacter polytrichastri]SFT12168.1 hypothetical protein SAMN04487890_111141 [Mucilaginibacter polytrichastri]
MFYLLIFAALIFFVAHVALLLASFSGPKFASVRYFYSHLTLWLTGIVVFVLALCYSGAHQSGFLDYFNTPFKKTMILVFTLALSLAAHGIVSLLVLPLLRKNRVS